MSLPPLVPIDSSSSSSSRGGLSMFHAGKKAPIQEELPINQYRDVNKTQDNEEDMLDDGLVDGILIGEGEVHFSSSSNDDEDGNSSSSLSWVDVVPVGSGLSMEGLEQVSLKDLEKLKNSGAATALYSPERRRNVGEGEAGDLAVISDSLDQFKEGSSVGKGAPPVLVLGRLRCGLIVIDEKTGVRLPREAEDKWKEDLTIGSKIQLELQVAQASISSRIMKENFKDLEASPSTGGEELGRYGIVARYTLSSPNGIQNFVQIKGTWDRSSDQSSPTSSSSAGNSSLFVGDNLEAPFEFNFKKGKEDSGRSTSTVQRHFFEVQRAEDLQWVHTGAKIKVQIWLTEEGQVPQSIEDILGM